MTGEERRLALIGDDVEELLADVQMSFWVELDRNDLVECYTLGQLFDRVCSKMGPAGEPRCLTSAAFYRVRRFLAEERRIGIKQIKPHTPLQDVVPWLNRRASWERIETGLRVGLPPLQPSARLMWGNLVAALAIAFSLAVPGHKTGVWHLIGIALRVLVWTMFAWVLALIVTKPLHRAFPEKIKTVGDLARAIARRNHAKMAAEVGGSTSGQAWRSFQELVASFTEIRPDLVRREMLFPQDLGIY